MPLLPIKLSKRKGMPEMGLRDNDILPSGGAMNSGITLDYSALGTDNGVPWNHADDKLKVKVRKAPDFAETGTWLVETLQGIKKMFSDIYATRWWYEDTGISEKHHGEHFLGFNKAEAIEKLLKKYPEIVEINESNDKNNP